MFYRDQLFSLPIMSLDNWTFNEQVAKVFLDMIQRSIPGYSNIIAMIGMLAARFVQPGTQIYDLGCSFGATTLSICKNLNQENCKIIAVDNSSAMIERCNHYINTYKTSTPVEIIEGDIRDIDIQNASLVVLNFTLQFLMPQDRQILLDKIYRGLKYNSMLVISEKFSFTDLDYNAMLISIHHDFKRANGYSELEISQKNSILKKNMLTDSIEVHKARLTQAGFKRSDLWFQYLNFGSLIAIKGDNS